MIWIETEDARVAFPNIVSLSCSVVDGDEPHVRIYVTDTLGKMHLHKTKFANIEEAEHRIDSIIASIGDRT